MVRSNGSDEEEEATVGVEKEEERDDEIGFKDELKELSRVEADVLVVFRDAWRRAGNTSTAIVRHRIKRSVNVSTILGKRMGSKRISIRTKK